MGISTGNSGDDTLIKLTKFNSKTNKKGEFVLNAEIIETIEETPLICSVSSFYVLTCRGKSISRLVLAEGFEPPTPSM